MRLSGWLRICFAVLMSYLLYRLLVKVLLPHRAEKRNIEKRHFHADKRGHNHGRVAFYANRNPSAKNTMFKIKADVSNLSINLLKAVIITSAVLYCAAALYGILHLPVWQMLPAHSKTDYHIKIFLPIQPLFVLNNVCIVTKRSSLNDQNLVLTEEVNQLIDKSFPSDDLCRPVVASTCYTIITK